MPSPFGHSLAGLAVAWAIDLVPGDRSWRTASPDASWYRRAGDGLSAVCMALAMAPDVDLGFTRHRTYTHSIGAVLVVGLLSAAAARWWVSRVNARLRSPARPAEAAAVAPAALRRGRPRDGSRAAMRIGAMCAAAYASHVVLDWLGVDLYPPPGLQVFWPFDSGWYISGLDLFRQTRREHLFTWPVLSQNFVAIAQETAILLPIVVALWSVRVKALARFSTEQPRRHHPPQ